MLNPDGFWKFAWMENDSYAAVPGCSDAEGLCYSSRRSGWDRRTINVSNAGQRLKIGSFGLHGSIH